MAVADVRLSRSFNEALEFRKVEGDDAEGWAVMANGESRIGLYEAKFMDGEAFSLNFRGSDVFAAVEKLKSAGYAVEQGPTESANGNRSAKIRDPDGHVVFFDCAKGESKKN